MSENIHHKDPRVIRTRQSLQGALLELLKHKSFQAISVRDISEFANVNRATFYAHYLDKFDLFAKTAYDTFHAMIAQEMPDANQFNLADIKPLTIATCHYLDTFLTSCSPANKPFEPMLEAEIQRVLYDYFYCWLSKYHFSNQHLLETCVAFLSAGILNAGLHWSRDKTQIPAQQLAEQVFGVITQGLIAFAPDISA